MKLLYARSGAFAAACQNRRLLCNLYKETGKKQLMPYLLRCSQKGSQLIVLSSQIHQQGQLKSEGIVCLSISHSPAALKMVAISVIIKLDFFFADA